jgi:hypothetical protein
MLSRVTRKAAMVVQAAPDADALGRNLDAAHDARDGETATAWRFTAIEETRLALAKQCSGSGLVYLFAGHRLGDR